MLKFILGVGALFAASMASAKGKPWPQQSYKTESFHIPYFNVSRQGEPTGAGALFLGIVNPENTDLQGPFIMEDTGELIWHGPTTERAYYNFQTQTISNQPVLTYWTGYLDPSGHGYGSVTILDDTYNIIQTICLPDSVNIVVANPDIYPGNISNPCYVDKHESYITDRNSIIVTAYNATQTDLTALNGTADGWVFDCLFFELDLNTNEILFQWNALDHVPVTKSNFRGTQDPDNPLFIYGKQFGDDQSAPWDFFHINSVQPITGGYLANSRMTWSFYNIDASTKDIIWTLEGSHGGDFKQLDPIFFSWEHNPRLQRTSENHWIVHLFNNDNIPGVAVNVNGSSGYVLDVNTKAMTVSVNQFLQDETHPPIYAVAEGSVQGLLNGHHIVGYGARPFIQEWDGSANLIYLAQFAKVKDTTHSYRVYRAAWNATPTANPLVVASQFSKGTKSKIRAYMSWNGATEYTSWNLYAGDTQNDLAVVASKVKKSGFETMVKVRDGTPSFQYVMVEALDQDGESLANSSVQAIMSATKSRGSSGGGGGAISSVFADVTRLAGAVASIL